LQLHVRDATGSGSAWIGVPRIRKTLEAEGIQKEKNVLSFTRYVPKKMM